MATKGSFRNLIGEEFDRLVVVRLHSEINYRRRWWCRCKCGNELAVLTDSLVNERTKSCGCRRRDSSRRNRTTHGKCSTREYRTWADMKKRCQNEKQKGYKDYGGRGITVCKRWQKFEKFLADMGEKPSPKHTIERKDNDRGYSKSNCVWATMKSQARNTRRTILVTVNGKQIPLIDAVEGSGVRYLTALNRYHRGCPIEKILSPVKLRPCS